MDKILELLETQGHLTGKMLIEKNKTGRIQFMENL
jgi:hypothetical protein